jgi:dihydrofolate reductase
MKTSIIVAVAENNVIGEKNKLPWYLPADLKRFKEITMGHHIIMGRKTYESIGKPLPGRTNIVITRNQNLKIKGVTVVNSLSSAFKIAKENAETEAFVIGGAEIFKEALSKANKIYMTKVKAKIKGDVFFPKINFKDWRVVSREKHTPNSKNPFPYEFLMLEKKKNSQN